MNQRCSSLRRRLRLLVLACLLAGKTAGTAPSASSPIRITIDLGSSGLDRTMVRDAIARELNSSIEEGPSPNKGRWLLVEIDAASKKARLVYREIPDPAPTQTAETKGTPGTGGTTPDGTAGTNSAPREGQVNRDVERTVDLPDDPQHAIAAIALLAGNLARDQTSDLVDALRRSRPQADSEPAPPPQAEASDTTVAGRICEAGIVFSAWPPRAVFPGRPCGPVRFELDGPYGRAPSVDGAQLGFVSVAEGDVHGIQCTWVHGRILGNTRGVQLSALTTWSQGEVHAGQVSGIMNKSLGTVHGVQVASIANAAVDVRGAQVSLVNIASATHGAQVGLVNVATSMRGVQVGLVNVASEPDGEMVGLVNVGRVRAVGWVTTGRFVHAGLQMGGRRMYTLATMGGRWGTDSGFDAGLGFGMRVPLGDWFAQLDTTAHVLVLKTDTSTGTSTSTSTKREVAPVGEVRAVLGYDFAKHFGVFAGGSVRVTVREFSKEIDIDGLVGVEF